MGDVVLLSEESDKSHLFLDNINNGVSILEMQFGSSKCEMLPQNWNSLKPNLVLVEEDICGAEFYLDICIPPSDLISDEVSSHVRKVRLTFTN